MKNEAVFSIDPAHSTHTHRRHRLIVLSKNNEQSLESHNDILSHGFRSYRSPRSNQFMHILGICPISEFIFRGDLIQLIKCICCSLRVRKHWQSYALPHSYAHMHTKDRKTKVRWSEERVAAARAKRTHFTDNGIMMNFSAQITNILWTHAYTHSHAYVILGSPGKKVNISKHVRTQWR